MRLQPLALCAPLSQGGHRLRWPRAAARRGLHRLQTLQRRRRRPNRHLAPSRAHPVPIPRPSRAISRRGVRDRSQIERARWLPFRKRLDMTWTCGSVSAAEAFPLRSGSVWLCMALSGGWLSRGHLSCAARVAPARRPHAPGWCRLAMPSCRCHRGDATVVVPPWRCHRGDATLPMPSLARRPFGVSLLFDWPIRVGLLQPGQATLESQAALESLLRVFFKSQAARESEAALESLLEV